MDERSARKEQIRTLVNQFYNKFEVLHRDTKSELYNKALIKYLDSNMTIEEIRLDMQNIVSERINSQNEKENILRARQKEISTFIDEMTLKIPGISQETIDKFKTAYYKDKRDLSVIKSAIIMQVNEHISVRKHELAEQQRINNIIANTPKENNKQDYIIYCLDENHKPISQPAKIDSVERAAHGVHDTMKIIVNDGEFDGFLKSIETSRQNRYEIVMSSIGNMLDIPIAQSYRVIKDGKEIAIISRNVSNNPQEELLIFKEWDKKVLQNLLDMGIDISPLLTLREEQFKSPVDMNGYKTLIDYNLAVMQAGLSPEEYKKARKQFLESIVFDYLVNQTDRNSSNYGIIVDKSSGKGIRLASLFDNSAVSKPGLNEDEMMFCNISKLKRHQLLECVYQYYYNDIKDFSSRLVANEDTYKAHISQISEEYLDYYDSVSFIEKVEKNYYHISSLEKQKQKQEENKQGYSEYPQANGIELSTSNYESVSDQEYRDVPLSMNEHHYSLEQEGPKLVRKLPQQNSEDNPESNNNGKISLTLIIIISLIVLFFAILGLYLK